MTRSYSLGWTSQGSTLLDLGGTTGMNPVDMDSSLASRKDLAIKLGYSGDMTNDSAQMNIWLHKTVLQKLSENGGNIPP